MHNPGVDGAPTDTGSPQAAAVPPNANAAREMHQRALNHASRPAALSTTPTVLGLLQALRRRWLLALTLGLVLAPAAAAGAWFMRPVTFTAQARLEVKSTPPRIIHQQESGDFNNYQRVQVALVKSRLVLNTVLRNSKVDKLPLIAKQDDPLTWLEREIGADFSVAPEIMRIYMTGDDTDALKVIVEAVCHAYLNEIVQKETRTKQERLKQLQVYYRDYERKLKDKEEALRLTEKKIGARDPQVLGAQQEFKAKYLHQMETDLLQLRKDIRNAELDMLGQKLRREGVEKVVVPEALIEKALGEDPYIKERQQKLADIEALLAKWRDRSPEPEKQAGYQKAVKDVETANEQIKKRRDKLRPLIVEQVRTKVRDDQTQAENLLQDRVGFLKVKEKQLAKELGDIQDKTRAFNDDAMDMSWMKDEIANLNATTKQISSQMEALQVEMSAPHRVSMLEPDAFVVPAQTEANRIRFAGVAGLGAFCLALFGVAFLEFRVRRVNHIDDISQGLKMKLVGSLPLVPRRALLGRATPTQNLQWQNRLMESVDAIRTTLLNAARFDGLRRVMVTSAVGGEGKTLLSCHLAVSLARAGCKTLLIDGDLRRPSVHKLFNLPLENGLSDLLRGVAEPAALAKAGPLEGLSVLTAGQSDSSVIQSLARERIVEVIQQVSQDYEFVIVDSAPVLPVADAQLIGQHVDGVVMSVMRDVSRLPAVYAAYERLSLLRVRILGAVVNGTDGTYFRSSYYYSSPPPPQQQAQAQAPAQAQAQPAEKASA